VLLAASRFWQIDSLYRFNAKFQPQWEPRYLCYPSPADLPRVALAGLLAEAFLTPPRWHVSAAAHRVARRIRRPPAGTASPG
jgi:lysyl-tRNA synthetase, class II